MENLPSSRSALYTMTLWMSFNAHQRENSEAHVFLESRIHVISTDKGFEHFVLFSFEILESEFFRRKAESNANIVLKLW